MPGKKHSQAKINGEIERNAKNARQYALLVRQYLEEQDYQNAARCANAVQIHALTAKALNSYLQSLEN